MLYNMICMDFDERKRRQTIRVIISEIGMLISVIAIVVVSMFAAMGFMISGNGSIEQSGLMQLHSLPTGASVKIDGVDIFPRTNLSRTLTAGTHIVELWRDGYDTWKNEVKIHSGVLLRLYYPRLFLQNRTRESVLDLGTKENKELEFYSGSMGRGFALYALKDETNWQLLDLRGDEIRKTSLDLTKILPGIVEKDNNQDKKIKTNLKDDTEIVQKIFAGKIEEIHWSRNEENVLVRVNYEEKNEWILVRLRDVTKSMNITKTFGMKDAKLFVIDDNMNTLYALENNQLRRINTNDGMISRVLVDNVIDCEGYRGNIIYITQEAGSKKRAIGIYRMDDKGGTVITEVPTEVNKVHIGISNYFSDDYIMYSYDKKVNILYGKLPTYSEDNPNLNDLKTLVENLELKNIPAVVSVSLDGEYFVANSGKEYMVIDLDMGDLYEYEALASNLRWFDASMMYAVTKDNIMVWDFDGANLRNLAESVKKDENVTEQVKILDQYVVMVTANDRWMYYLMQDKNNQIVLTREKIRE